MGRIDRSSVSWGQRNLQPKDRPTLASAANNITVTLRFNDGT